MRLTLISALIGVAVAGIVAAQQGPPQLSPATEELAKGISVPGDPRSTRRHTARSALGLALNPYTGEIWEGENGPNGGDELNVLKPGRNYGWPIVSYGRDYNGPRFAPSASGFEEPVVFWVPSIAASGLTFYTGDRFPAWKRKAFVGGLRESEVAPSGQLQRIVFNDKWEELRREPLLRDLHQRVRDVRQGPDGLLYLLTDEDEPDFFNIVPLTS
jgi:glucose/arabinose dehydrogenase